MPLGYIVVGQQVGRQTEDNFTAGQNANGRINSPGGMLTLANTATGVALASQGTNTTAVAGQWWITDFWVPVNRILSNLNYLSGGTATTSLCITAIWDSYGRLLASSKVAGTLVATTNVFQVLPIALVSAQPGVAGVAGTSLKLYGPQQYFIGVQTNDTTAGCLQTIPIAGNFPNATKLLAGTFGTVPVTITVPVTQVDVVGPFIQLT